MDLALAAQSREAAVYKRELVAWYKQQRKEQEDSRMTEEQTAKEKFKVYISSYVLTELHNMWKIAANRHLFGIVYRTIAIPPSGEWRCRSLESSPTSFSTYLKSRKQR